MDKQDIYQHRMHNRNLLYVHLVFVTKYRHPVLTGTLRTGVMQSIYDTCRKNHWYIQRMETDIDHIHILLQYNPADSISAIATRLKQSSARQMWENYGDVLKKWYWKRCVLWSGGYFACSIGNACRETIEKYIENQG